MSGPKIRVDSFWGDLANALVLSPVYREPVQPEKAVAQPCNCNCNCGKSK
jgi:hypothetical protein